MYSAAYCPLTVEYLSLLSVRGQGWCKIGSCPRFRDTVLSIKMGWNSLTLAVDFHHFTHSQTHQFMLCVKTQLPHLYLCLYI